MYSLRIESTVLECHQIRSLLSILKDFTEESTAILLASLNENESLLTLSIHMIISSRTVSMLLWDPLSAYSTGLTLLRCCCMFDVVAKLLRRRCDVFVVPLLFVISSPAVSNKLSSSMLPLQQHRQTRGISSILFFWISLHSSRLACVMSQTLDVSFCAAICCCCNWWLLFMSLLLCMKLMLLRRFLLALISLFIVLLLTILILSLGRYLYAAFNFFLFARSFTHIYIECRALLSLSCALFFFIGCITSSLDRCHTAFLWGRYYCGCYCCCSSAGVTRFRFDHDVKYLKQVGGQR